MNIRDEILKVLKDEVLDLEIKNSKSNIVIDRMYELADRIGTALEKAKDNK